MTELKGLIGQTMVSVVEVDHTLVFTTTEGRRFRLYHNQDCCESVTIESIVGDLSDLVGEPLLMADESSYTDAEDNTKDKRPSDESYTWTFYKFATRKGYVDVRWFGTSNGYYSESVCFEDMDEPRW